KALKKIDRFSSLSLNHLIIKAAAYALANEPRVNCAMKDGQLYDPGQINIGIITAIDDGLLIPVIKDAANLNLADLAFEAKAAIDRAKAGRPSAQDLVGGTFSISNMGMFDVENFTAIINPGQGAVLAVSATKETPVVEQGSLVIRNVMKTTLSVDHRIIDGIMSANFLSYFKLALETPALLME
ncbi:MAG: 2-oxo acid dehydrogenase subunit E2, partial [Bdellovibrionales bacterium]|nr:2-oxo acid dehydrogenase subunit E2 [Bdellovibrionales bacterium]